MPLGFEALNDIVDLSVVGSCNRQQVGCHHDVELDHGRPSYGRRGKLVRCIESVSELELVKNNETLCGPR